jgi:hypothetical protein
MHKGRGLQSVVDLLLLQIAARNATEFVIHQRHQGVEGLPVPIFPFLQ